KPSNNPSNSRRIRAIELAKTATAFCHCRCGYNALVPCVDFVSHYKVETLKSFDHKLDRATRRIGKRERARTQDHTDVGPVSKYFATSCARCPGGRGHQVSSPRRD